MYPHEGYEEKESEAGSKTCFAFFVHSQPTYMHQEFILLQNPLKSVILLKLTDGQFENDK